MAVETIPMNLSALSDITPLNITVGGEEVFNEVIATTNSSTDGLWIFAPLFILFIINYLVLTDKSPLGDFGYGDLRGLNLAFAICFIIGLKIVEVGWSTNFFAVGMFGTSWVTTFIGILIYENQE